MSRLLEGKVAVVTGAGAGIGRAHALALSRAGAKVVVNDLGGDRHGGGRGAQAADLVAQEIQAQGGEAVANHDTVATREGVDGILWAAQAKFGRVDVWVNNAGILRDRTLLNLTDDDFDRVLEVHLRGTFLGTQVAARAMRIQGQGGRIVNTTSLSGLLGNFGQGNYGAAKAGIYGLTRVAALELERFGIAVNAIAPVAVTRMTSDLKMFAGATEAEMGPQLIAPAAVFLASPLADGITGQVLGVQGGKVFLYRMETTAGVEKDVAKGPWTPEEIRAAWERISA
ncbi:MAG: SDR family NAD(P)-dependent oxidoreductase [Anaeromyxobacteraceae bacterium]